MNKMIACCGLICTDCPAFIAEKIGDEELRVRTAQEWSEMYNTDIKPEDIACEGCLVKEGKLFKYGHICKIRSCCHDHKVTNCAYCEEYPCKQIDDFCHKAPEAKTVLESLRKNL